jgi:hypothetical protein
VASCLVLSPVLEAAVLSRACYVLGGRVGGCGKLSGERPSEHDPRAHAERQGDGEPTRTHTQPRRDSRERFVPLDGDVPEGVDRVVKPERGGNEVGLDD